MKKFIFIAVASFLAAVLLISTFQIFRYFSGEKEAANQFSGLAEQIVQPPSESQIDGGDNAPDTKWTVNDQYGSLFKQNADMIGWIKIDGTALDYPVMQTPKSPNYYLRSSFEKEYSEPGTPFAAENCSISPQSDNITIYGHHMKSGKMFGSLDNYRNIEYWREHPIIQFDTLAGFGQYEIFAVFKVVPADFMYHEFVNATSSADFSEYVSRCKELSFYDTEIIAEYGDKLITLSTCEYSAEDSRLVVVARKIEEGV